jgi:hypothetical protein
MVLGLTASVVALASCSSDELIQAPSSAGATPIAFNGVAVNKSTRSDANEITGTTIEDFVINGWISSEKDGAITNSSVLTDETVNRVLAKDKTEYSDADTWSYTNKQYWTDGNYYFSAIAPASVLDGDNPQVTDFDNVVPTLASNSNDALENTGLYGTFTFDNSGDDYSGTINAVKTDDIDKAVTEQTTDGLSGLKQPLDIDLVYASATANGAEHIGNTNDAVSLSFNHLLSRVAFKFTNDFSNNNTQLAIKNIIVYNVAKSANVTIPSKAWSDHDGTQNLVFGDVENNIITAAAAETLNNANPGATDDEKVNNEGTSDNFYLIPAADTEYLVTLDIEQYTGTTKIATYQRIAKLPKVTMEAGKSYLYTLLLNPETIGLNEITFTVSTVADWGDYDAEGSTNAVQGYPTSDSSSDDGSKGDDDGNDQQ